ncbi:hypothetical protein VMCG_05682 [Cytospora schulzeri]|uniref:Alpha-L-rhamnosidase six-hairpin glycosidase domain-containing protein n=1 Tax=Cytospora schulzeri TaxID=448051 RepID=A0A423WI78_9PEZI|nr:hypothetical protein VMCG_05682 [Valsa malicola]
MIALALLGLLAAPVLGGSCWRNTTCSTITEAAFPGEWEANIFAPESRTVVPKSVLSASTGEKISSWGGHAKLATNGSQLVFDFGKEVGGIVRLEYTAAGNSSGAVGLAFTEAKNWIGEWSDSSNGKFVGPDGAIYSNFTGPGSVSYTMPDEKLRGGFRYLTLFLVAGSASVDISSIELEIGFQPTWSNLRAYQGYFHSSDALLNSIWYSGAYTLQTNAVPVNYGRCVPFLHEGWANNGTLGPGDTIIVDGAKRDRAVWPGDMGIAVPSTFVSVGDLDSVRNALQAMYDNQNADGSFPEAGPPLLQQGSDTYHMWTMIGTYNYLLYTNDTGFLARNWDGYLAAMDYIQAKVQPSSGLLNVTGTRDWARWQTGFNMSEAQMILYRTLTTGADLATWHGGGDGDGDDNNTTAGLLSSLWTRRAASLQNATMAHCFDTAHGSFRDNATTTTTLHPQDANSMAVLFGLVAPDSPAAQSISARLTDNWTPLGAEAPELPGNISPFISSFEIQAHLTAGRTGRALELVRTSWGWYLNHPGGSESTVVEGYLVNGTFGYRWSRGYADDFSYVSHSHGWSSGPTSALTEFVLGLSVTGRVGSTWRFAPQFGDLEFAEGGFTTSLGKFQAGWSKGKGGGHGPGYEASLKTPEGTVGTLVLPVVEQGRVPNVLLDGKKAETRWYRKTGVVFDTVVVENVEGGQHSIVTRPFRINAKLDQTLLTSPLPRRQEPNRDLARRALLRDPRALPRQVGARIASGDCDARQPEEVAHPHVAHRLEGLVAVRDAPRELAALVLDAPPGAGGGRCDYQHARVEFPQVGEVLGEAAAELLREEVSSLTAGAQSSNQALQMPRTLGLPGVSSSSLAAGGTRGTPGKANTDEGCGAAMTSKRVASDSTSAAMGPSVAQVLEWFAEGQKDTREWVVLRPKMLQKLDGMRMLPPPSLPRPMGISPTPMAAPVPEDEPPV